MARLTIDIPDADYDRLCLLAQIALRSPSNQAVYMLSKMLKKENNGNNQMGGSADESQHGVNDGVKQPRQRK